MVRALLPSVSPPEETDLEEGFSIEAKEKRTHRRYTESPTAVPIRAALIAVDTMDPARPLRRFEGGSVNRQR